MFIVVEVIYLITPLFTICLGLELFHSLGNVEAYCNVFLLPFPLYSLAVGILIMDRVVHTYNSGTGESPNIFCGSPQL